NRRSTFQLNLELYLIERGQPSEAYLNRSSPRRQGESCLAGYREATATRQRKPPTQCVKSTRIRLIGPVARVYSQHIRNTVRNSLDMLSRSHIKTDRPVGCPSLPENPSL